MGVKKMGRSVLGVIAASLIAAALLAGTAFAGESAPGSGNPIQSTGQPLVLSGVIADPRSAAYLFFESIPTATGTEVARSGRFEVGPDGSFQVSLVRPQRPGPISVFIVEAGDPATATVDENGCTEEQRRGVTLEFDSAEAVEAGSVTVRLTDVYSSGLCPPAVGTPAGWGSIDSGWAEAGAGDVAAAVGGPPSLSPDPPLAAGGAAAGPGGALVTPPPTEASAVGGSAGVWLWLAALAVALLGVLGRLTARGGRAPGRRSGS